MNFGIMQRAGISAGVLGLSTVIGTLLSLVLLGFEFGNYNNVFHVPYVLDWPAKKVFQNDAFYQTLRYFTSVVWPVMRLVSTEDNVGSTFFIAHVLSRALVFVVLSVLLVRLGLKQASALFIAVVTLAVTPWLQTESVVGGHGMLLSYFTHSEVTWPFLFGSLLLRMEGKPVASAALAGITFSINAFVGIWLSVILAACWLFSSPRDNLKLVAKQIAVFLLVAAPVAIWIQVALQAPQEAVAFSFTEYVRAYFPNHFLIEAASSSQIVYLALILVGGLLASMHVPHGRIWRHILGTASTIFLIGTVLPYIADNRLLFNLHLLRIDGLIQFISVVLIVAASVKNLYAASAPRQRVVWLFILFGVTFYDEKLDSALIVALFLIPFCIKIYTDFSSRSRLADSVASTSRLIKDHAKLEAGLALMVWVLWSVAVLLMAPRNGYHVVYLSVGLLCGVVLYMTNANGIAFRFILGAILVSLAVNSLVSYQWRSASALRNQTAYADLQRIASWIRLHPVDGEVLLSRDAIRFSTFQIQSRNPVWVDWKQGAAVMWYPPFYAQWITRYNDVMQLADPVAVMRYAQKNRIAYFVYKSKTPACPGTAILTSSTETFMLCKTNFDQ